MKLDKQVQNMESVFLEKHIQGFPNSDVRMLEIRCNEEVLRGKSYLHWVGSLMRIEKDISYISDFFILDGDSYIDC